MTELDLMKHARTYLDALAGGRNPLDGSPLEPGDVMMNPRLSRCMAYVSQVLGRVIEGEGTLKKEPFFLPGQEAVKLPLEQIPLPVTRFAEQINSRVDPLAMEKLKPTTIGGWLLEKGFLQSVKDPGGKTQRLPTPQGQAVGLFIQEGRDSAGRTYHQLLYSPQAQQFVLKHMEEIAAFQNRER